jgi:hypothetical protein
MIAVIAFFVYKNFDFITEVTFKVDRGKGKTDIKAESDQQEKEKTKKPGYYPSLKMRNVQLPPIDFELPCYFYFEIYNSGDATADNVQVTMDLGKANLKQFEVRSASNWRVVSRESNTNMIKLAFNSIGGNESAYVYALLTMPVFKKIVITCDNVSEVRSYTIEDFMGDRPSGNFFSGALITFFRLIFGGIFLVFVVYSMIVIITWLNRLFKLG